MIVLRVYGEPQPQGSKRAFRNKHSGRINLVESGGVAHKSWREAVAATARDWQAAHDLVPIDDPVMVSIEFWLTRPASLPKWRWLPKGRPDCDKLVRAVLDSITSVLIRDDGRVVDLHVQKRYAVDQAPGCEIRVVPIDERAARQVSGATADGELLPPALFTESA